MEKIRKNLLAILMAVVCITGVVTMNASSVIENMGSTKNTQKEVVIAASNVVSLGSDTITYESYGNISMQIPCEERGGIYFLNNNKLSFYNLNTGNTTLLETFLYNNRSEDEDSSEIEDVYVANGKLYILLFSSWWTSGETTELIIYDLVNQTVLETRSLTEIVDTIAVDSSGRMLMAESNKVYLFSAAGDLLDSCAATDTIYDICSFDTTGKFYAIGYVNWVYWGYNHSMNALCSGNVTNNKITVDNSYNILISQKYWYERQRQVEALSNKYLCVDNTFNSTLQILDYNNYSTSDDDAETLLELSRDNTEAGSFDSEAATGTRTVYLEKRDSIITFKDNSTIAEYNISDGKECGSISTAYPVFSLMKYGDEIIAIEKNDSDFYLERFTWKHATKLTITSASNKVKVGNTLQLQVSTDGTLTSQYTYKSSNSKIASVNQSGKVTGWNAGTATITVKTSTGISAKYTVKVTKNSSISNPAVNVYSLKGAISDNVSANNYSVYGNIVNSYLVQNSDSTLTRVEYTGNKIIIETYSSDGKTLKSKKNIKKELDIFGGFYSGKNYNFIVYGQKNTKDSDKVEVMRVVKYSKSWKRIKSVSYKGCNTYIPFDAGSLRMTETNGMLYIHTCHEMYDEGDGYHHQANMTYVINESNMSQNQQYYDVMNIAQAGYVSHSFNQFIQTDGEYVYRVDHGDAYPRGITITKCQVGGSIEDVSYTIPISLGNVSGNNATGASVGGFELSDDNCLIAANSVNYTKSADSADVRNICVAVTGRDLSSTNVVWFTKYKSSSKVTVRTPQLVKINDDQFLLMWEEYNQKTQKTVTAMVTIDGSAAATSDVVRKNIRLSDCQPIYCSDGNIRWYVTNNGAPCLYTINPYLLNKIATKQTSIAKAKVSKISTKTYTGKAIKPSVTVTLNGKKLKKNSEYAIEYKNNKKPGIATVTIKGVGKYKGTITKTFNIKPAKLKNISVSKQGTGSIKVKWKADSKVAGYQIVYSTDSTFVKDKHYVTIKKKSTTSKVIKDLTSGKKYYIKVRAYKTVNGKKIYGAYNKVKSIKVK